MAWSLSAMGSRESPLGTHCYQSFDGSVILSSATYPINDATDETLTPTSKLHFALLILLSHKKASKIMGQPLLDFDLNGKESGKLYFIVTYTGFLHIYEYDGGIISILQLWYGSINSRIILFIEKWEDDWLHIIVYNGTHTFLWI